MKKILLPALVLLFTNLSAQLVNEQVHFDNPNDQSDHFYGMQSLVQIPNYGVTGGCLLVPDSNNWGNDNSRYCSKFMAQDGQQFSSSIMFYYNDSMVNPNSFDRAASIWMQPHADPNHYIIASLNHDGKLELLTYFSADYSSVLNLTNNNWYELSIAVLMTGNSLSMNLMLVDRGSNGQMPPTPVDFTGSTITDSLFANDDAIEVSITGSKNGGSLYFDNFDFTGIKSADSCLTSGISILAEDNVQLIIQDGILKIESDKVLNENFEIYSMTGKKVQSGTLNSFVNIVDISKLKSGFYILNLVNSGRTYKIAKAEK